MQIKMRGLTEQDVLKSRDQFGSNEIIQKERDTFWGKVLDTIKGDPIIQILFVALAVQLIFYYFGFVHWYEPFGIFIAVTLATLVGTWSEFSSENQFQDLQEEASRIHCKVFRDGLVNEILINEIVVGDLVVLQTGDKIPADGILVAGELKSNQVSLNGENESTCKLLAPQGFAYESKEHDAEGSPLMNPYKLYRESVVEEGEAVLQVMKVGKNTLSGSLSMGEDEEIDSPLKAKLSDLARGISMFGYIGGSAIAIAFVLVKAFLHPTLAAGATMYFSMANMSNIGPDIVHAIILAILIIVMAVPEGLPMMIAIVLSLNMKKLLKDNILVRKMVGIETAGSLNILFSDKTGTITEGKLSVVNFYAGDETEYTGYDTIPVLLKEWVDISLSVNTNASYNKRDDGSIQIIGGNVTEKALLHFVHDEIRSHDVEVVSRINFNSADKFMASQVKGSHNCTLVKGAPEVLLDRCNRYYANDGLEAPLTVAEHKKLNAKIDFYAAKAMRVIAITTSQKEIIPADPSTCVMQNKGATELEDMTLVGLVAIRDDIKPSSKEAFRLMTAAGVQVVMITGDRKETAHAIAQDMGMLTADSLILTSQELQAMSDEEVKNVLSHVRVVSRALPQDKLRLVKLSQELGLVTGMTGDGANDKPALEKADVGFSMGSGTEVAKEASDIVILDDSLDAISKTTLYGRTIYKSIQKFIKFQVTVSFGAVLIAFIGPFIGVDLPLSMTQILWINLIMDTLAALALGGEPSLTRYMAEKPKKRTEAIVSPEMWSAIVTTGLFIVASALIYLKVPAVFAFFGNDHKTFQTGFFLLFVFANVMNLLNVRNQKLNIFEHITENQYFLPVFGLIVVIQLLMTYFGGDIMRAYGLSGAQLACIVGWTMLVIVVDAVRKSVFRAIVT
ncbi:MAG: calcium-translocating P-type ATPase, PMCA-type [Desulfuromonadales bacterium]